MQNLLDRLKNQQALAALISGVVAFIFLTTGHDLGLSQNQANLAALLSAVVGHGVRPTPPAPVTLAVTPKIGPPTVPAPVVDVSPAWVDALPVA